MGVMKAFSNFLVEETTEEKLTHLEHPEDHPIKSGEAGFHHAFSTLKTTAQTLQGHDTGTRLMTKFDGAPSVIFGRNPENGKFFVASKSAFNKTPKINYTAADIEHNHGHAPVLVNKLKAALKMLPKAAPPAGVFQGDFMYNKADNDVREHGSNFHFKPQLIDYSAPQNSKEGRKIKNAQIGFAVHTGYEGKSLASMKANYTPDLSSFNTKEPSVHLHTWNETFKVPKEGGLQPAEHDAFKKEMNAAGEIFKNSDRSQLFAASSNPKMQEHLSTYVNKTVREGTAPTVEGLAKHVAERHSKGIEAVKTAKTKEAKTAAMQADLAGIKQNQPGLAGLLKIHQHLQNAKHALMPALERASTTGYGHSINGVHTGPEGFVAVTKENRPTKLVNRAAGGFSQANLQKGGFKK
jgi:hypothetical protein